MAKVLKNGELIPAAMILGVASLVSRIVGLIRERVLTTTFGAGDVFDSFVAAFRVPDLIFNLIVLGALAGVLVGTELASRLSSHTLRKVFAIFLAIVAVKMFTASPTQEQRGLDDILTNQKKVELVERTDKKNEAEKQ